MILFAKYGPPTFILMLVLMLGAFFGFLTGRTGAYREGEKDATTRCRESMTYRIGDWVNENHPDIAKELEGVFRDQDSSPRR